MKQTVLHDKKIIYEADRLTCVLFLPVNIFWKAVSTFVESNADVSINDNVFFSENTKRHKTYH